MNSRRFPLAVTAACLAAAATTYGATFTVGNGLATGTGSLHQAIEDANATPGKDTITFSLPGSGPFVIAQGGSPLPSITGPVDIDGTSQAGWVSTPIIVIQGIHDLQSRGLDVQGGDSTIRGVAVTRWGVGVFLFSANNTVQDCYIGTDESGEDPNLSKGDDNLVGVRVDFTGGPVSNNKILSNLISANGTGIHLIASNSTQILGNRIGTNGAGTTVLGNAVGILVAGSSQNLIGDGTPAGLNVISGNGFGIQITGSSGTQVRGNLIGPNAAGTGPLLRTGVTGVPLEVGNFLDGILVNLPVGLPVIIGGTDASPAAEDRNLIAYNRRDGVRVQQGNAVSIRGNSIHSNAPAPPSTAVALGINLCSSGPCNEGVTPNDAGDADTGPNALQNYPVPAQSIFFGGITTVLGTLNGLNNTAYTIDFYANLACDPSGKGEGQRFLGSTSVTTNNVGNAAINAPSLGVTLPTEFVTATATAPDGSTSEFSACIPVTVPVPLSLNTVTPCRAVDTRLAAGPFGGPALTGGAERVFLLGGRCNVPADAKSVSLNLTVTGSTAPGDLRLFPAGAPLLLASTINYGLGQTRANNAVAALGAGGGLAIRCDQAPGTSVHVLVDVNGYFR